MTTKKNKLYSRKEQESKDKNINSPLLKHFLTKEEWERVLRDEYFREEYKHLRIYEKK